MAGGNLQDSLIWVDGLDLHRAISGDPVLLPLLCLYLAWPVSDWTLRYDALHPQGVSRISPARASFEKGLFVIFGFMVSPRFSHKTRPGVFLPATITVTATTAMTMATPMAIFFPLDRLLLLAG